MDAHCPQAYFNQRRILRRNAKDTEYAATVAYWDTTEYAEPSVAPLPLKLQGGSNKEMLCNVLTLASCCVRSISMAKCTVHMHVKPRRHGPSENAST